MRTDAIKPVLLATAATVAASALVGAYWWLLDRIGETFGHGAVLYFGGACLVVAVWHGFWRGFRDSAKRRAAERSEDE